MNAAMFYTAAVLSATVFDVTFDRANEAFSADNYAEAATLYEQLVADGVVDPNVFYNLGNAYFRDNKPASAIANYERALQLDPNFDNATQNLKLCIDQTPRGAGRPLPPDWEQSLLFWHYGLSTGTSAIAAAIAWLFAWGLLTIRLARPVPYLRAGSVTAFLLAALFAASVWSKTHPLPIAVANDPKVSVHFDRDASTPVYFELLTGDRVLIEQVAPDWLKIEAPSGERGWAQRADFILVGPPYEPPTHEDTDSPDATAPEQDSAHTEPTP